MSIELKEKYERFWRSERFRFLYHGYDLKDDYTPLQELAQSISEKEVGDNIIFSDSEPFTVVGKKGNFVIVGTENRDVYSIIDTEYAVCGPSNLVFGISIKKDEDIEDALADLISGESYISYRNSLPIDAAIKL